MTSPVAFFAPLKSPEHPTPSGDRALARGLLRALELAGFSPELASELRCLDLKGDPATQAALQAKARQLVPVLISRGQAAGWRMWMTYHNYYKAPDLLGPAVCQALGIPYVQVESTRARKRLNGPWDAFAKAAEAAADQADVTFHFTQRDAVALKEYAPARQSIVHLHPFLARETLPPASSRDGAMLTVAMMREGDKLASYRLMAEALALVKAPWRLDIAGDGPARSAVETLMAPFGNRVRFLGECDTEQMQKAYSRASLLFWPGVNEAIGLVFLEAQAAGIPVVAQDRPGLRDVLADGVPYPAPQDGPGALAKVLDAHLSNPVPGEQIRAHARTHTLLPAAAQTLKSSLDHLMQRYPA